MKSIINIHDQKIPIKSWVSNLEEGALQQSLNLANHPVTKHHVALMPDSHLGNGMPIGGVVACKDAVIPNAVGVDIGCGMTFIKTNVPVSDIRKVDTANGNLLHTIVHTVNRNIPVGFAHHKEPQTCHILDNPPESVQNIPIVMQEIENAKYQLGTLGGGNHFIEFQEDPEGNFCIMIHSGSRNFGYKIAEEYNKKAIEITSSLDKKLELNYLPVDSQEGQEYLEAMYFALQFAKENRALMLIRVRSIAFNLIKKHMGFSGLEYNNFINIHHNFANKEEHFGEEFFIHRKGATQAFKDQLGIIPGSMGTPSYIVKGLGNPESFMSCSHGAGRTMGRNQFTRTHTKEECDKAMEGIIHTGWGKGRKGKIDLSEAPQAYKNIDEVIENEKDLIEVVLKLKPVGVVKG